MLVVNGKEVKVKVTYPIHRQIMPDTVLPSLRFRSARFVGVVLEPVVDVAEDHRSAGRVLERLVDQLGVWLLFVDYAVVSAEIMRVAGWIVVRG